MNVVPYARKLDGFRRLNGLGDSNSFSGCVQGYDADSNPVSCSDPTAVVWMDANGNTVPAGPPYSIAGAAGGASSSWDTAPVIAPSTANGAAGAATGSLLLYQAEWQVSPTLNANTIISRVSGMLSAAGLQVVSSQNNASALTVGDFNIAFTLQVIGGGYGTPSDAGSMVDHAYYTVTGHMPVYSSTVLTGGPGSAIPQMFPASTTTTATTTSLTSWFESNALWIGLGFAGIALIGAWIRK